MPDLREYSTQLRGDLLAELSELEKSQNNLLRVCVALRIERNDYRAALLIERNDYRYGNKVLSALLAITVVAWVARELIWR